MIRFMVGDLIDLKPGDPQFDTFDEAYREAQRQHDNSPDDRCAVGIWLLDDPWQADLVAIYCDGWLYGK